jgi:hypothetical protein
LAAVAFGRFAAAVFRFGEAAFGFVAALGRLAAGRLEATAVATREDFLFLTGLVFATGFAFAAGAGFRVAFAFVVFDKTVLVGLDFLDLVGCGFSVLTG